MAEQLTDWQLCYIPDRETRLGRHARFADIMDRILAGWTSRQIEVWLQEEKAQPVLLPREIEEYIRTKIPATVLTAEHMMERMGTRATAEMVNELAVIQQLCMAQLNRVSRRVKDEEDGFRLVAALMTSEGSEVTQATPQYDKGLRFEMEQLRKLLLSSAEMKFRMGILKSVPQQLNLGTVGAVPLTAGMDSEDAGMAVTEREKERVAMALKRIVDQIDEDREDVER